MPTTRRSTGGTRARPGPAKGQSTISFASKVTKAVPKDIKGAVLSTPITKDIETDDKPTKPVVEEEEEEEVVPDEEEEEEEQEVQEEKEIIPEKSEAELKAEKITDAQIKKYWKEVESVRIAPRVHQQDLSLNEKVLRYFDVSSQYGPCVGIARMKRWQRAERLGLQPPIEVLSVLLKEEAKGVQNVQVAEVDQILNASVAVEA